MSKYKFEFMTDEYAAEMEKLWNDGHQEAIFAFGAECMNFYKKKCERFATGAIIAGGLAAVAVTVGKKVYHKLKEEKKPTEKSDGIWVV